MGRPKKGNEVRAFVGIRIPPSILDEVDVIADTFFSKRTSVLEKIIILGLEEFKKQNADMMKLIENREHERAKLLHEKKRHGT